MIFIDIDGVLANFSRAFSILIQDSDPSMSTVEPENCPDWETWGGELTSARLNLGWEKVRDWENFWESLSPMASPSVFQRLADSHKHIPILFVTSRTPTRGRSVQQQCVNWLEAHGVADPLVIVADSRNDRKGKTNKAAIARIWNPYFVIEDCPQNALDYAEAGFEVALLDWPYTERTKAPGIHRCSLDEALEMAGVPLL